MSVTKTQKHHAQHEARTAVGSLTKGTGLDALLRTPAFSKEAMAALNGITKRTEAKAAPVRDGYSSGMGIVQTGSHRRAHGSSGAVLRHLEGRRSARTSVALPSDETVKLPPANVFWAKMREDLKPEVLRAKHAAHNVLTTLASGRGSLGGVTGKGAKYMQQAARDLIYGRISYRPLNGKEVPIRYGHGDRVWERRAKAAQQAFVAENTKGIRPHHSSTAASRKVDSMLAALPKDSAPSDIVDRVLKRQPSAPTHQAHAKNDQTSRSQPGVVKAHLGKPPMG